MQIGIYAPSMCSCRGGDERSALVLSRFFVEQGHKCTIFYPQAGDRHPFYTPDFPLTMLPVSSEPRAFHDLRTYAAKLDVAILLHYGGRTTQMLSLFNGLNVPLIVRESSNPAAIEKICISPHYRTDFLSAADKIVMQCASYLASLPPFLLSRAVAIANPIEAMHPIDWEREARPTKKLLAVGRLEETVKKHALLIEAFARLAPRFPDWNLEICGEGSSRNEYEALRTRYGLETRISLPGNIEEINERYAESTLFCIPSAVEGLPLALLEAQSHGLPSVGFASCPGVNEIIVNGENGILVREMSVAALAATLEKLMADKELRAKFAEGSQRLASRYDRDKIFAQWEKLLTETAELKKGRTRLHVPPMTPEDLAYHGLCLLVAGNPEKERMRRIITGALPSVRQTFLRNKLKRQPPE